MKIDLVHLTARPFVPELRCTLGRETAIQKMIWTDDGWLRMADGSNLAKEFIEESKLPEYKLPQIPSLMILIVNLEYNIIHQELTYLQM